MRVMFATKRLLGVIKRFKEGLAPLKKIYSKRPRMPTPSWLCVEKQPACLKLFLFKGKEPNRAQELKIALDEIKLEEKVSLSEKLARFSDDFLLGLAPQKECFHTSLTLNITNQKAIEQVLPFQLESLLPFPIQEAVIAFSVAPLSVSSSRIFVSATKKSSLENFENFFRDFGLEMDRSICPAFALSLAHKKSSLANKSCLYAWLHSKNLSFFLIDSTGVRGVRDALFDIEELSQADLELELRKTALYLQAPASCERRLIGDIEAYSSLVDAYDTPSSSSINCEDRRFFMLCALGEALEQPQNSSLFFKRVSKRNFLNSLHKWKLALDFVQKALFLLSASLLVFGVVTNYRETKALDNSRQKLITLAKEHGVDLESSSLQEDGLDQSEALLEKALSPYPLFPDSPTARDLLGFLTLQLEKTPGAKLISFDYVTETMPTPKNPSAKYRVKVDLELEITDVAAASELQERLMHAFGWIERPTSLIWKPLKDRYKVSFYLKDRTAYAP